MEKINYLWKSINGNKSWILLTAVAIIMKLVHYNIVELTPQLEFTIWLLDALAVGAIGHRISKGSFSVEKR